MDDKVRQGMIDTMAEALRMAREAFMLSLEPVGLAYDDDLDEDYIRSNYGQWVIDLAAEFYRDMMRGGDEDGKASDGD